MYVINVCMATANTMENNDNETNNNEEQRAKSLNSGAEQKITIPRGNIILGFHGGYNNKCMHNLGIISIPYKSSVGYDLVKRLIKKYYRKLSYKVIGYILDYVFYLDDGEFTEELSLEFEDNTDEITWDQPRNDAKGTCLSKLNYDEKQAKMDAKV